MPKRRANGEGNIRKRKDGRWEGRYTVGHDPETGKAIIKNVLGKTQAEVKEKLKKAIEENVGIDYGRAKTYTVGNWLEVWYENYAKIKMRPSTYLTYHGYIENHIKPQLGKIPLNDLTTLHLQQFYKKLLAEGRVERIEAQKQPKGLSAKTVRNIHQIISSALKLAVEQRLIAHNPADGCALPKAADPAHAGAAYLIQQPLNMPPFLHVAVPRPVLFFLLSHREIGRSGDHHRGNPCVNGKALVHVFGQLAGVGV